MSDSDERSYNCCGSEQAAARKGGTVCGGISIVLVVCGFYLHALAAARDEKLDAIHPEEEFQLEQCTIVSTQHTWETVEYFQDRGTKRKNGVQPREKWVRCEDKVEYLFEYCFHGDCAQFSSRQDVSGRNHRASCDNNLLCDSKGEKDRCTVGVDSNQPYATHFACQGLCETGETVDCWKPSVACGSSNCDKYDWANCGNKECMKLVDPKIELQAFADEVQVGGFAIGVIVVGALLGLEALRNLRKYLKLRKNNSVDVA
jgi:hypothetical protein